jgi:transposase
LEQCPELRSAAGHVRAFGEMLTKLRGQELPAWIAAVRAEGLEGLPGLTAFADSLTSDLDAVTRGLTTRWNSGPIEGRVNHIKMLKRQMFGRASLPLLRKRVLLTASRPGPTVPSHPRMSASGARTWAPPPSAHGWVR